MNSEKTIFAVIGFLSVAILSFLFWLIYFKTGSNINGEGWVSYLPALNAFLNALTATFLITGYVSIRLNDIELHKKLMFAATTTSAFFLLSYVTYHHYQGDTKFLAVGLIRPIYFFILITHILLSIVQVPLILTTLYLAFTKQFVRHKKFARVTFPIWLYVSTTGVLIFIILKSFN